MPRKNIRPLGGKPVIGHVIETLRSLPFIARVHVSTDDPEVAQVAEARGATCLGLRDPALAGDGPGFIDLVHKDLDRYVAANGGDSAVLFVLATAVLVPATVYREAYEVYQAERPDLLMSCAPCELSPFRALVAKADGFLEPLFPDKSLVNSQDLPPAFADAGLFYFFDAGEMAQRDSFRAVDKLMPFMVAPEIACDVDRPEDWALLERKYAALKAAVA